MRVDNCTREALKAAMREAANRAVEASNQPLDGNALQDFLWSAVADAALAALPESAPIPMVLHCPACGVQHIDKPEGQFHPGMTADESLAQNDASGLWSNPPHRSHLCQSCGHIWRPADVATTGIERIQTRGKADSPAADPTQIGRPAGVPDQVLQAVKRERDGWQATAQDLQRRLHLAECDLDLRRAHQERDVWFFQGDGEDHLESLGNRTVVVIHAADLRTVLQETAQGPLQDAKHASQVLHGAYIGEAMPDAVYEAFRRLRDRIIPALRKVADHPGTQDERSQDQRTTAAPREAA